MTQIGRLIPVSSTDGVHFTGAAAQDVALLENLPVQSLTRGLEPGVLRSIRIMSSANRQWEVAFYDSKDTRSADPNEDGFLGRFAFTVADGVQVNGTGLFRYYVNGLYIFLEDSDNLNQIHVELISRDSPKSAYGAGELFRVAVAIEPVTTG